MKNLERKNQRLKGLENLLADIILIMVVVLSLMFLISQGSNPDADKSIGKAKQPENKGFKGNNYDASTDNIGKKKVQEADEKGKRNAYEEKIKSEAKSSPDVENKPKELKKTNEKEDVSGVELKSKASKKSDKININTASAEQLASLSGIGEVIAERIVKYRIEHGNFKKISDIKRVSGIGEKKYNKIKDSIVVE